MRAIFCLALIFCAIWGATSVSVLNYGTNIFDAFVVYNQHMTLEANPQTIRFPPWGYFMMEKFGITKIEITSNSPNGLRATVKSGGRSLSFVELELKGQPGTEFTLTISAIYKQMCSRTTTMADWSKILNP